MMAEDVETASGTEMNSVDHRSEKGETQGADGVLSETVQEVGDGTDPCLQARCD